MLLCTGASSGDDHLEVTPEKFEVVGSEDCVQFPRGQARVLLAVQKAGFHRLNQANVWVIPPEKRASLLCLGIRVLSSQGSTNVLRVDDKL